LQAELEASLDQAPVELSATYCQAPVATLDPVVAEESAQSDESPLAVESGSVARFPVAERSEAQSRRCQVVNPGQDDQEDAATLDQAGQERSANLDQEYQGVWANLDRDRPEVHQGRSDEMDEHQGEQKRQERHCNTRLRRELMP
jgi:hypothetical protein